MHIFVVIIFVVGAVVIVVVVESASGGRVATLKSSVVSLRSSEARQGPLLIVKGSV